MPDEGRRGEIAIREARPTDVSRLLELLAESAAAQGSVDALCVTEESLLRYGFGDSRRFQVLVAESSGHVVAIALYLFTFSTWTSVNGLHLEDLYVDAAWRRRGIARALMRRLADIAAEHDCRRFKWFVLRSNREAIAFYESLGAVRADEWEVMQLPMAET